MSPTLGIVAWGRRGATVRLTLTTAALLRSADMPFALSVSSGFEGLDDLLEMYPHTTVVKVPASRLRMLAAPILAHRASVLTRDAFQRANVTRAVVIMPHPWDLTLFKHLRDANIEIIQMTHDARPHPGELWPRQRDINRRMAAADATVFLTESVAALGSAHARRSIIAPHPALAFTKVQPPKKRNHPPQVLFIGRIRPYKGIDRLFAAWPHVTTTDAELIIAGEGTLPDLDIPHRTRIINRWLSDPEIEEFVRSADVVVLPYSEASQSGITVIAREVGTPVVTTPLAGLLEQYEPDRDGIASRSMSSRDLAGAIDEVLARSWKPRGNGAANEMFLKALLTPSDSLRSAPTSE